MTVSDLIEELEKLPAKYEVRVSCGKVVCIWVSDLDGVIDIDYGNTWYGAEGDGTNPAYRKAFDAFPGKLVEG